MTTKIFKSYDVRGLYPKEIDERLVERIGRAFVAHLNARTVAIACDKRSSSPSLVAALIEGLTRAGADVIDLGLLSTPMLYFASSRIPIDGAIMVTASHNPGEYNGLKFCKRNAVPIGLSSGLAEIRDLALAEDLPDAAAKGTVVTRDMKDEYREYIASFAETGDKRFRIVTDTAHAMGVLELPIYDLIPNVEVVDRLYDTLELPGVCPHEANPLKAETLEELASKVVGTHADLGVAYDGDADRIGFVDETGAAVPMDLVTALLARALSDSRKEGLALYDLRSSRAVKESIEMAGWSAHESKVGHANIKKQMIEEGAILAGEVSGHYYFALAGYIAEMGTLPAVLIMNLMAKTGKRFSELVHEVSRYAHSGEINLKVDDAKGLIELAKSKYSDGEISTLDGVKIVYPAWWFSLRSSNTEPLLRLNVEADTEEIMVAKRDELLSLLGGERE